MRTAPQLKPYCFKPGQSGNPGGRARLPEHLKAISSFSQEEIAKIISKYGRKSRVELTEILKASTIPAMDLAIVSIFLQAITHGDTVKLSFLLDRAIGRPTPVYIEDSPDNLTTEELIKIVKEKFPELESA